MHIYVYNNPFKLVMTGIMIFADHAMCMNVQL